MINGYTRSRIRDRIREKCEEDGHVCPFWADNDIEDALYEEDKLDNGQRLKKYLNQCHEVHFTYRPDINIVEVNCRRIDICLGDYYGSNCNYSNPKVAAEFLKEYNENVIGK